MFDFFKGKSVIKSQELSQIDNRVSRVIEKYINETSRECYSMQVIEGIPTPLDSHMGGMPYMPQNTKWPLDKEENQIPFLIQINFNGMNLEKFPSNGILQIFYNWENDEQCVRYYEELSQNFQTEGFLPKWHYDEGWTCGTPLKLELQKKYMVRPIDGSDVFDRIFAEVYGEYDYEKYKKTIHKIWKELEKYISKGNIGGWANSAQGAFNEMNGELTLNGNKIFLFIDSMLNETISIGDAGYIWAEITPKDLEEKNFEKLIIKGDCY